jgi:8-oxo-dGTP pyrophosphatase MutT (NUDIX family)
MDNLRDIARATVLPTRRDPVEKVSYQSIPQPMLDTMEQQGMTQDTPLGPGSPIAPVDGFSRHPRTFNYRAGYNIAGQPRINEQVSFSTLQGLVETYDIAALCISHRVDTLRSFDYLLTPAPGVTADMTEVTKLVKQILRYPDRELPFRAWLAKYLYDVLAYDAGALYRERNLSGQVTGLTVIDGTTIAPVLDGWGRIPGQDYQTGEWAPAYRQFIQGMPWNWLTKQDLIYTPFTPRSKTPYGYAPMERILINANTDIRFQLYFMQRFTEGNIPQMFASAPEAWTPQQVEDWQARWDALMAGDQKIQNRVEWVPGGSKFDFINRTEFAHEFPMWLLQKTAAAYHVVPADLGWTEKVNKANGQVQENISERNGTRPLQLHVEDLITAFIQDDLGVPLEFHFDQGTDDAGALLTAQADQIYVDMGAISPSDIRETRYGLAEKDGATIPRYIMTPSGPMPLSMLLDESAPVDQATGAPNVEAINPGSGPAVPLAPVAPAPQMQPMSQKAAVAKAIESPDAIRKELAAFRRFAKGRTVEGWRDFRFEHVDAVRAHRLNVGAFSELRKDAGDVSVAGLAVVAADTGRVLMLQRALDADDPNGGYWELPGGHIEPGETPREGASREWSEEVAAVLPQGVFAADWVSPAGNYAGFVMVVPDESCVDPSDRDGGVVNPDDPDGDNVESVAWWDPALLVNNPGVRPALAADISLLLQAVISAKKSAGTVPSADGGPVLAVVHGGEAVMKDGMLAGPTRIEEVGSEDNPGAPFVKGWRDSAEKWPGHRYDLALTDHYSPAVLDALEQIAAGVDVAHVASRYAGVVQKATGGAVIAAALTAPQAAVDKIRAALEDAESEGYVTGMYAGGELTGLAVSLSVDWDSWSPGDTLAAAKAQDLSRVLADLDVTVQGIVDAALDRIGNRIAEGLAAGESSDAIARSLVDAAGGRDRADLITHTEVARAQTSGAFDTYRAAGVQQYDLLVSDGACDICTGIAAAGPYDMDDDTGQVPIHPRCRCADSPHIGTTTGSGGPDDTGTGDDTQTDS